MSIFQGTGAFSWKMLIFGAFFVKILNCYSWLCATGCSIFDHFACRKYNIPARIDRSIRFPSIYDDFEAGSAVPAST